MLGLPSRKVGAHEMIWEKDQVFEMLIVICY